MGISLVSRWPARVGVLLAVLLVSALSYALVERATGEDVPKCERFAAESLNRQQIVTGRGQRVVVIGDSYSVGLGLEDAARAWPRELPGEVHVHGFSGSGFSAHASPCGRVSYADRAARAVRGGADLVILEGGLNDVHSSETALRTGVRRVLGVLKGVRVVIVGPVPAPDRMPGAAHVDSVLASEAARAHVPYVSMIDADLAYLDGGLHLTRDGHRAFGDLVVARLP
ncbi:SGNH/GDSL hydrolase family protein [Nocardioides sp. Root151]|uniref:SGNH/GDSL hydrolase family protein n=1 Tax=Nocardioides sp. Root151 TaxID=1736475 RepID=UPI000A8704F5|nr:SGNH/GDSL hydrolase family protein [Nocardioides sp. Root151]